MHWLRASLLAAFLFCPALVAAADTLIVKADHVLSGDEIALQDKRILRLTGIKALSSEAQNLLQTTVAGQTLTLQNATGDRYNRIDAVAALQDQSQNLEDTLLTAGLAFVYPASGDDPHLDAWLKLEREARAAKRGAWADHPDTSSDDAEKLYGAYGFVTGTITKAERIKNKFYLNFGADWRTDFTVQIAAHDLRAFKQQDIDLATWPGKRIRVRGWIKRDFGPMITVTDPHQIEVLD